MGVSISSNVAKQLNATATQIATTYAQSCQGNISTETGISLNNCTLGSDKHPVNIDITSQSQLSITCMQSSTTRQSMKSSIKTAVQQQATAITQSLGLPSVGVASAISNVADELATSITDTYTQTCISTVSSQTGITCTNSSITADYIKISGGTSEYDACVAKNTTDIIVQQTIENIIGQTTAAKEENSINAIVVVVLVVLGALAIFFVNSTEGIATWIVVFILFLLVIGLIVYAFFAQENGWYPFARKNI